MESLYIVDVVEMARDGKNRVRVYGITESGERRHLDVVDIPTCFHYELDDCDVDEEMMKLKLFRSLKNAKMHCRNYRCVGTQYGVKRDDCLCDGGNAMLEESDISVSLVWAKGFVTYEEKDRRWVKVALNCFGLMPLARSILCKEKPVFGQDANVLDAFLIGTKLSSFEWVGFPAGKACVSMNQLVKLPDEGKALPSLRVLTFDIETVALKYDKEGTQTARDPVGLISCKMSADKEPVSFYLKGEVLQEVTVSRDGKSMLLDVENDEDLDVSRDVLNAKRVKMENDYASARAELESSRGQVRLFDSEREMICAWFDYVRKQDPDVVCTYNGNSFDVPYVMRRAKVLGLTERECALGRSGEELVFTTSVTVRGGREVEVTTIDCPGRVFLDMFLQNVGLKLHAHKLSDVAEHYGLGGKGDVRYDQIYAYFHGGEASREELLLYCVRDTLLTEGVCRKMDMVRRLVARSRILRVRARCALDRGGTYYLYMLVRSEGCSEYLIPELRGYKTGVENFPFHPELSSVQGAKQLHDNQVAGRPYEGGFVQEPKAGVYRETPILTFDFSSLYPNTARTFNVCPTTLVGGIPHGDDEVYRCSNGFRFSKRKEGVLPRVWRKLLEARSVIKQKMKHAANSDEYAMLDAEQLETKLAANSLYGQLGAGCSKLVCLPAAASITKFGSDKIKEVAAAVTDRWKNVGAQIIYGDTDSIMTGVRLSQEEAWVIGDEMQAWINGTFLSGQGTLSIEFEDLSLPSLFLQTKKRYVKVKRDRKDFNKTKLKFAGLEKRDGCPFIAQTMSTAIRLGLLESEDVMFRYLSRRYNRLVDGRVSISNLTLSAALGKRPEEYANPPPHVRAALAMKAVGLEVQVGERVPYIYSEKGGVTVDKLGDAVVPLVLIGSAVPSVRIYRDRLWSCLEKSCGELLTRRCFDLFGVQWRGLAKGQMTVFGVAPRSSQKVKTGRKKKSGGDSPPEKKITSFFKI